MQSVAADTIGNGYQHTKPEFTTGGEVRYGPLDVQWLSIRATFIFTECKSVFQLSSLQQLGP